MEKIIPLVTALFLLSMICERIAEFFKNFLSSKKIKGYEITGDVLTKYPDQSEAELRRHYRILKLNLVCGFVTAFLCHASFFDFLQNMENPGRMLKWPAEFNFEISFKAFLSSISFLLGCFLTGAFISLGSKFWHDLLDILLAVKNAKRSIEEATTQGPNFNALSVDEKFSLITAVIKENKKTWKNSIKNYRGVSIAEKLVGKDMLSTGQLSIRFNVTKKEDIPAGVLNGVPACVFYNGYSIPTDVLETGEAHAVVSPISPTEVPRPLGSSIGRENSKFSGTLGINAIVGINGAKYNCGLSCYHVLFPEELKKRTFFIGSSGDANIINNSSVLSPSTVDYNSPITIGNVVAGKFTDFIDIGFFITKPNLISDRVFEFGKPAKLYELNQADERKLKVKICGRTSGIVKGTIFATKTYPVINYFKGVDAFEHELLEMIQIEMKAQRGDSGSAVLTEQGNQLVGIIVAVDSNYSYAIPIQFIKSNFDVEFNLQNN